MNTPDEYLFVVRIHTDALKARSLEARYRYAEREQDKIAQYFILRAADIGEASFQIGKNVLPQVILARVLCEDFILFFWTRQSEANATNYARAVRSEWIRTARRLIESGRARITHAKTGQDHSRRALKSLEQEIVPRLNLEQIANQIGLAKVYDLVYRFGSLTIHAKTFDTMVEENTKEAEALAAPLCVITGMLRVTLDVLEKNASAADVLRRLDIESLGGT